jgi:hypothetical protein
MAMKDQMRTSVATAVICLLVVTGGCAQLGEQKVAPAEIKPEEKALTYATGAAEQTIESQVKPAEQAEAVPKETPKPEIAVEQHVPEEAKPGAVLLTLKFAPQDVTTYRVTTESGKSVDWEGSLQKKPSAFKGGRTGSRIEMTFTQRIQSVDDEGNAVAEITIKGLKYLGRVRDNTVLDFDSSRQQDQDSPLMKLIGQNYTVEISPAGELLKVVDVTQARAAVGGSTSAHRAATGLLSAEAITKRHTIAALSGAGKHRVQAGEDWSKVEALSFDMMGSKSYEKVYTLKEVKDIDNRTIATVDMQAIPSSEMAQQLYKEQTVNPFAKMFDSRDNYTGRLKLDLTAGKIEECLEELTTEWVMVDPNPANGEEPSALRMTATRLYHVEKIE